MYLLWILVVAEGSNGCYQDFDISFYETSNLMPKFHVLRFDNDAFCRIHSFCAESQLWLPQFDHTNSRKKSEKNSMALFSLSPCKKWQSYHRHNLLLVGGDDHANASVYSCECLAWNRFLWWYSYVLISSTFFEQEFRKCNVLAQSVFLVLRETQN